MAGVRVKPVPGSQAEWQERFTRFKAAGFYMGVYGTLAAANLEEGDNFPDDDTYEIIRSQMSHGSDRERVAEVVAMKEVTV